MLFRVLCVCVCMCVCVCVCLCCLCQHGCRPPVSTSVPEPPDRARIGACVVRHVQHLVTNNDPGEEEEENQVSRDKPVALT